MRVEFTEEMSGYYTPGAPAYDTGFVVGRRDWNHVAFRLTIGTGDVKKFLADPDHAMWAKGVVRCPEFHADDIEIDCEQSNFKLFTRAGRGRYLMKYRLVFTTPSGDPMTLLGYKDVGDDWGFDAWTDTTTLYIRLVRGIADEDAGVDDEHGRGHPEAGRTDVRAPAHHVPRHGARSDSLRVVLPGQADRRIPGPADQEADVTLAATESSTEVIPFTAGDGMALNMHRVRGKAEPWRGPVILVHGAGVRANIFRAPERETIVDALVADGWDVWLENWRASIDVEKNLWNLDQAAVYDHPRAVDTIVEATGAASVKALIHCQGSSSFALSSVAGLLPKVDTIVSNAMSLHPVVPWWSRVKLDYVVPVVSEAVGWVDPHWGASRPDGVPARAMVKLVHATHRECDNTVCKMVSFTYGAGRPGLWRTRTSRRRHTPGSPRNSAPCH